MAEAAKWFQKAANQGYAPAQAALANLFRTGSGVLQIYSEAVFWYRKAAEQGDYSGQGGLGYMYARGLGVKQDFIEAYKWLNLAAAQGDTTAAERRDGLLNLMTTDQIAEAQRRTSAFVDKAQTKTEKTVADNEPKSSGTAFFITNDGYLLTNFHVIANAEKIVINTGKAELTATVIKADAANDLAILKVSGKSEPLPVAASRSVKLGDPIFTIGFPNIGVQGSEPKLTKGEINSLAGIQDDPRYFQISTPVQPGNSGGPLVDKFGNVVGIVTLRLNDLKTLQLTGSLPQNVNYALKSSLIIALFESVPNLETKLKPANPNVPRDFATIVKEAEQSVAIVIVY